MNIQLVRAICKGELVKLMNLKTEKEIPTLPWESFISTYANTIDVSNWTVQEIQKDFVENAKTLLHGTTAKPTQKYKEAQQRHFDFYVNKSIQGNLLTPDLQQLALALTRMKAGTVRPR